MGLSGCWIDIVVAPSFHFSAHLGAYQAHVDQVLREITDHHIMARLWERDHTVWKAEPTELHNRLGWLQSASDMKGGLVRVDRFVRDVHAAGYRQALV
jgi:hypothetical protein